MELMVNVYISGLERYKTILFIMDANVANVANPLLVVFCSISFVYIP